MAGHNKWSKIKRKKAGNDAKRGKIFTKILREIQVAAKAGADLESNIRLKTAIAAAKANSVPADNVERAIKRGSGAAEGIDYEEITYEGYAPGGVAILIKTLSDNKNRTVSEVRHALVKYGGSLASANSVAFQFEELGVFLVNKNLATEEELFEKLLDAGLKDILDEGDAWRITCEVSNFANLRKSLEALNKEFESEVQSVPKNLVPISGETAESVLKLLEALEDLDDVQNVSANFDIEDNALEVAAA